MSIELTQHELKTATRLPLRVDLRRPATGEPLAPIIVVHGFKGFKDWGFFPHVSERLADAGFAVATFDFSMNGVGDRRGEFDRLDLFEANTYSQELDDLTQVKAWLAQESPIAESVGASPIGILGHSRGALCAMVAAAEDANVAAVVTWNGVGKALRYTDRQLADWEQTGRMEFVNSRTGQDMAVAWSFVDDARAHAERFDPARAAEAMQARQLILHAEKDLAVDVAEAEWLHAGRSEGEGCRVVILEKTGHTFGAVHPFEGSTEALDRAIELTVNWFRNELA